MISRRNELNTLVAPKAILQQNIPRKKRLKNKFKGYSQIAIMNKIVLVIALSISLVCKDAWFIDSGASQHLTF
jgi:hypothetical protein